ncbi:MAG: ATP-binding cassette domain-containing protein [Gemmatimonadota bacterium]|nr:ATP-binding cassette domain-containing protein [Gemmatimonadota bacterium]MDE3215127.1 ATP-binding cassette domain-containing protein [Gemmatimonadota bacterium]
MAIQDVDLELGAGRVHALLGENGAGKSTLMGVLFGLVRPDRGTIRLDGAEIAIRSPRDAVRLGVGMVQQHFANVGAFTVAENVALGGQGRYRPRVATERVRITAQSAGLAVDPNARVADLPVEAQQRVEIVRALARGARLLILDEPTAVLAPAEAAALLAWLRQFAREGGTVVLVTHKVAEALAVADDVTVLRGGRRIASGPATGFTLSTLAAAMFPKSDGTDDATRATPPAPATGEPVLRAHGLAVRGDRGERRIVDATFSVRAGEIVGIAGVEGSGHHELLQALAGVRQPTEGILEIPGRVSFVPGDRHRDALILDAPLYENFALHGAGARTGLIGWPAMRGRTQAVMAAFDVKARSPRDTAGSLSGGNQQRFVLGRELDARPDVLVVENPTRGLDLQATASIHRRLREAAAEGAAVLVHSADLDEILALAQRIFVVHAGIVREVPPDRDGVGRAMVGAG